MGTKILLILCVQIVCTLGDKYHKSKRGVYPSSESFNSAPIQISRYPHIDSSQVDLTYKGDEDGNPVQTQISSSYYPFDYDPHKHKTNEQSFSSQHHIPSYAPNHYHQFDLPKSSHQQQYPLTLQPKSSTSPLHLYPSDKHLHFASSTRAIPDVKLTDYLDQFSSAPIIYGQPSAKYQALKTPYNLAPITVTTNPQYPFLQQYKASPFKIQIHHPQPLKALTPNYYKPQLFNNPIVPQLQHYIPANQNQYNPYLRAVTSAPITVVKQTPKKIEKPKQEEEPEEDDDKHERREEIKGEITHHEINDEDEFEKGYKDAARDFPTYDDDDDYERPKHYYDDDSPRYERYRSRYEDHDDDDDPEAHYSQKQHKKEPREKYREATKSKQSHRESSKQYKGEREDRPSPKKPHSVKYYKASTRPRKSQGDSKYESTSTKKSVKKTYKTKESDGSKGDSEFKPTYQYGFEPVKSPYGKDQRYQEEDSVAKHSSPVSTKKTHKETYYASKTTKS